MKETTKHRVPPSQLSSTVPDRWLPFKTTADLSHHPWLIGQERALRAIEIGLQVGSRGFNIFAVGESGSGKTTTIERMLKERASQEPVPDDLCYVYNFKEPEKPRPILLPKGIGRTFAADMARMIQELERVIPKALSDNTFGHMRSHIIAETRKKSEEISQRAEEAAQKLGLQFEEEGENIRVFPLHQGKPIEEKEFDSLPARKRHQIEANMIAFQEHMSAFSYGRSQLEREHASRIHTAEVQTITPLVNDYIKEIADRNRRAGKAISAYLDDLRTHILDNHQTFMTKEESESHGEPEPQPQDPHHIYQVNVVLDRSNQTGAPVVVERMPSVSNLAGYFEYREAAGGLATDHTMIRAGSLHQANGGYLLIQVADMLTQEGAWETLKRSLRHKEVRVDEGISAAEGRPRVSGAMKPGEVRLNLKVILVGSQEAYYYLKIEDEEFGRLFKIKADFEPTMDRTKENVLQLAQFLGQVCREEGHLPIHRDGMKRVLAYASRRAQHQNRLTARRADLLDVLAEANLFACKNRARSIRGTDIDEAINECHYRASALSDRFAREIQQGSIFIRTEGMAIGQINGIALYDTLGSSFGIPVRITARTYVGRRGVVNIDREVQLSGAIHDKGAMILVGYLGGQYAQAQPLGFSASITFEQSYDEIDGDSASSAELYTLLSALSGCPIRQGIAVTGSVNQLGEIQPIGGVNEKIEGVFRICRARGFKDADGVMIPKSNVVNLLLDAQVIKAVRDGQFSIYAVSTVDEGIEVLTGVSAGRRNRGGNYSPNTINGLVQARLGHLGEMIQRANTRTIYDVDL